MDIPTRYNPKEIEDSWYSFWEKNNLFFAQPDSSKKKYSIVIPPPNITGILHMGHALNNTIQDILIRYKRLNGFETLWMPGTDHAGIATQNVVERKLKKEKKRKEDLGRENFIKEVWQWRDEYGSTIINQLKKMGASCDWRRTRFTMDDGLSEAVKEVFLQLYEKKLIYRGNYIINWCPRCKTALSDEESEHRDVDGMLYHIKYPIKVKSESSDRRPTTDDRRHVVVATTRPETMLGDVAICVNPKDERYTWLKDRVAVLPLLNRTLVIITDYTVDPNFGTGVLKVTPAHDPVDFELGNKHKLERINVMNEDATINSQGKQFEGMNRLEAREAIVEELKKQGLLIKTEPHRHAVGHCYRCHSMIEPRISKQWFVKMKPLSKPAIKAVRDGKIKFYPPRWTKVYLNWMDNIRDWCISRQIWWGHRLPVYYCMDCTKDEGRLSGEAERESNSAKTEGMTDDGRGTTGEGRGAMDEGRGIIVSKTKPEKCPECGGVEIQQDPDVLDTWFSSWLWPFSTLGWPEKTKDLDYFYPTDCLVTAQEIIFFWVARMIMAGTEFMKDIPFSDVYIHGTVRDDKGTKMSKSLGNVIDPIDIINKFGADALRFSIICITSQGQDVFLSEKKFEIGRNFTNKLWNAARFVLLNLKDEFINYGYSDVGSKDFTLADKWIISRFASCLDIFSTAIKTYRINEAANCIYDFIWGEYCDWYVELSKITIDEKHTQVVLRNILEDALKVLHPIMPFITEDLWQRVPSKKAAASIMVSGWPVMKKNLIDKSAGRDMQFIISVIKSVRNLRAQWRVDASKKIELFIKCKNDSQKKAIEKNAEYIRRLSKVEKIECSKNLKKPKSSAIDVILDVEIFMPLHGVIDVKKEKERLGKKMDELLKFIDISAKKLKNKKFTQNAPKEVIEKVKDKKKTLSKEYEGLKKNLEDL